MTTRRRVGRRRPRGPAGVGSGSCGPPGRRAAARRPAAASLARGAIAGLTAGPRAGRRYECDDDATRLQRAACRSPVARPARRARHRPRTLSADARTVTTDPIDRRAAARDAGLRYRPTTGPGITRRRAGRGFTLPRPDGDAGPRPGDAGPDPVARRSRRRGRTSGSARTRTATSRRPAATRGAASSTATTRGTARARERRSSTGCSRSPRALPRDPRAGRPRPRPARGCRARRCSPRSSGCSS